MDHAKWHKWHVCAPGAVEEQILNDVDQAQCLLKNMSLVNWSQVLSFTCGGKVTYHNMYV